MKKSLVFFSRIRRLSIPVIAEVFGLAAAAGCQLVASCDIVVAGENASFSVPGVKHGYRSFIYLFS